MSNDNDFNFDDEFDTTVGVDAEPVATEPEPTAEPVATEPEPEPTAEPVATEPEPEPAAEQVSVAVPGTAPAPEAVVSSAARPPETHKPTGEEIVYIELHSNDDIPPGGLPLGLNGRQYQLRPGTPAKIPKGLLGVLRDSVADRPIMDGRGKVTGYRKVPRHTFTQITREQYEAYQEG